MKKGQEYVLAGVTLLAVILALIALILTNNTVAIAAAVIAIVAVLITFYFIYLEEEVMERKIERLEKEKRR